MRPFSLLIKPASADCNLRCAYCFYLDRAELYPNGSRRMKPETLDALVKSYMATEQPQYAFAWQGGEPTLMGLEFFERVVELQMKYGAPGASVANHLQTNGLLIGKDLARHLARYNFLVGVSLDGPPAMHDRFRRSAGGRGSHDQVMQGIGVLRQHGVKFNILSLVSSANVGHGAEVYRYLRNEGFDFHQYIPCVEFDDGGRLQPFAVTPEAWGDFLCQVFDQWIGRDAGHVSIRFFDSIIYRLISGQTNLCHMGRDCRQYLVVEHNGDVFPCDFFVDPSLKLGNVLTDSWHSLRSHPKYAEFGTGKRNWDPACADCQYLELCGGDCLKHRRVRGSDGPDQLSWLCRGYKRFFAHALPGFMDLARSLQSGPDGGGRAQGKPAKVGRNDPCPCGSGRKFKKCCGGPQ
jgi:uncharacterized protein